MSFVNPRDTSVFADIANIYGLPATEEFAGRILATLDLKMTATVCARLNAIISGIGNLSYRRSVATASLWHSLPYLRKNEGS
jgi:aryl-alcohol dehydrogenase-like predicted oxidoreductase